MSPAAAVSRWAMLLETRKRSGEWVGTPVNAVADGDRVLFSTGAKTHKVKRMRNFPEVRVAPSTLRGEVRGERMSATARRLEGEEAERAARLLTAEYPFVYRVLVPVEMRMMKTHPAVYELTGFGAVGE